MSPRALRILAAICLPAIPIAAQSFTPGNILATHNDVLFEYTCDGTLVQSIPVPYPGGFPDKVADIVVDTSGQVHVANYGNFRTSFVSTYDPVASTWIHNPVNALLGTESDYDLSILNQTLYTKNESIQLPSFVTAPIMITVGGAIGELSAGLDGLLYALDAGFPRRSVRVMDPGTMSVLANFNLVATTDARGIAVVPSGDLYVAGFDGNIQQYDPAGQVVIRTATTGSSSLYDIDVGTNGIVVAGSRFGKIFVTDLALSAVEAINLGSDNTYVSVVPKSGPSGADVGVVAIDAPLSGAVLASSETVTVTLGNFGTTTESSFPVSYTVTGPAGTSTAIETFSGSLMPLATSSFTFAAPADLSVAGTYTVQVSTQLSGDVDASNDSATKTVIHQQVITSFPYVEDFEANEGGFITNGRSTTWEHGQPAASFITGAASGGAAWVTKLDGPYFWGELSYLVSPPLDFTSLTNDPFLSFSHIYWLIYASSSWVEVSIDGGPFTKLGAAGDPVSVNWYNDASNDWWDLTSGGTGTWRTAQHIIPGAAGRTVVVRWVMSGGNIRDEDGVGVDDVRVFEAPFGAGQPPRLNLATLDVSNALEIVGFPVSSAQPGPYFSSVSASGGGTLDFRTSGGANQPITLLGGALRVGAASLWGGQLDLEHFSILASGLLSGGLNPFFVTNQSGQMRLAISVPATLVGYTVAFQALLLPGGDSFFLTNAVQVSFVP